MFYILRESLLEFKYTVSLFLGDSPASEFYEPTFQEHCVWSIFIGVYCSLDVPSLKMVPLYSPERTDLNHRITRLNNLPKRRPIMK
jgi:hypothetical protein